MIFVLFPNFMLMCMVNVMFRYARLDTTVKDEFVDWIRNNVKFPDKYALTCVTVSINVKEILLA